MGAALGERSHEQRAGLGPFSELWWPPPGEGFLALPQGWACEGISQAHPHGTHRESLNTALSFESTFIPLLSLSGTSHLG